MSDRLPDSPKSDHISRDPKIHPGRRVSHRMPLAKAEDAYKVFLKNEEGCMKVVLTP